MGTMRRGSASSNFGLRRSSEQAQSPVREALRDLAAIGIIEIQARQGARVRMPSNKELADVSIVRSELDALAARLAVEVLDVSLVDDLQQLVEEMAACIAADDHRSMALADAQFHGWIAEAADNVAVQRVFDQLEPFGRTFVTLMLPNVDVDGILHEHEVILSAIRAGDGPGAAAAARVHQLNVSSLFSSRVPAGD